MTSTSRRALLFALTLLVGACQSGFDAPALDGPWSTGHSLLGIGMALQMTWEGSWVRGHGSFASETGTHCGNQTVNSSGTVELFALRQSATQLSGWMSFGDGSRFRYEGTLTGTTHIDGSLVAADGTACPLIMFNGLVP